MKQFFDGLQWGDKDMVLWLDLGPNRYLSAFVQKGHSFPVLNCFGSILCSVSGKHNFHSIDIDQTGMQNLLEPLSLATSSNKNR